MPRTKACTTAKASDGTTLYISGDYPACSIPYHIEAGGVAAFAPTMAQFVDFNAFLDLVQPVGALVGLIKVIPPSEYSANVSGYSEIAASSLTVHAPIRQHVSGQQGVFRIINEAQPDCSLAAFIRHAAKTEASRSRRERSLMDAGDWAALEECYWKNVGFSRPIYGADSAGSIFDESAPWNMSHLNTLLSFMGGSLSGINRPMLYFGEWKATFAIHVEDANLYSINYIHSGQPKQWYAIPPADSDKFEAFAAQFKPANMKCSEYLRHKDFLIKPAKLRAAGLRVVSTVHHCGEFMITYPHAYHYGYNYGFNIAESVNFATEQWFEHGDRADVCQCRSTSVRIDVQELKAQVEIVRQAREMLVQQLTSEGKTDRRLSESPISFDLVQQYPSLQKALQKAQSQADGKSKPSMSRTMTGVSSTASIGSDGSEDVSSVIDASVSNDDDAALAASMMAADESDAEYHEECLPDGIYLDLMCGYDNCDAHVFKTRQALLNHYQQKHSSKNSTSTNTGNGRARRARNRSGKNDENDRGRKRVRRGDDRDADEDDDALSSYEDDETNPITLAQQCSDFEAKYGAKNPVQSKSTILSHSQAPSQEVPQKNSQRKRLVALAASAPTPAPVKEPPAKQPVKAKPQSQPKTKTNVPSRASQPVTSDSEDEEENKPLVKSDAPTSAPAPANEDKHTNGGNKLEAEELSEEDSDDDAVEIEGQFEVDSVSEVRVRKSDGAPEFRVHWSDGAKTWEPLEHVATVLPVQMADWEARLAAMTASMECSR